MLSYRARRFDVPKTFCLAYIAYKMRRPEKTVGPAGMIFGGTIANVTGLAGNNLVELVSSAVAKQDARGRKDAFSR